MEQYRPAPNVPIVSALIERMRDGKTELLIQTRGGKDPEYQGTFEIPAGWMEKYENVYEALKREVYEETGLKVIKILPDVHTEVHSPKNDGAFAFVPFCAQQQLKGGLPWVGFVFRCEVEDKEPTPQREEVGEVLWVKKAELERVFRETPEKIFTLQLGVLDFYFKNS